MTLPPPFSFPSGLTLLDVAKNVIADELKLEVLRHVLKQAIDFSNADPAGMRIFAQELLRHGCAAFNADFVKHDDREFRAQLLGILHAAALLLILDRSKVIVCPHHGIPPDGAPHHNPPSAN